MNSSTLINGLPGEHLPIGDRALQYGDGLFETISCLAGEPRWLERHLQRLREGCRRLQIPFDAQPALGAEVRQLAQGHARCIVKVIVSRGVATRRGYRPSGEERTTRIVSRHEWPQEGAGQAGREPALQVGVSGVALGVNPRLAGMKHLNRLEQVLAQLERPAGLDEVLMLATSGEVISGSMSNLFLVDAQGLFTPPVDRCGVAGVMRGLILDQLAAASQQSAPAWVRPALPAALVQVREAFLTNVRWGIRSIGVLDGRALPSDDWAQRLRRSLDAGGG